jgi:hypothetical protein
LCTSCYFFSIPGFDQDHAGEWFHKSNLHVSVARIEYHRIATCIVKSKLDALSKKKCVLALLNSESCIPPNSIDEGFLPVRLRETRSSALALIACVTVVTAENKDGLPDFDRIEFPVGIEHLFINGQLVLIDGVYHRELAGRVLRRQQTVTD